MRKKVDDASTSPQITVQGNILKEVQDFTYLGSIISASCTLDRELNNRINKASAAFGQLKEKVYLNRNLKIGTKIRVYQAIVISVLLYGAETWTLYSKQLNLLDKFHMQCLRRMLGLTWRDRVTNNEVLVRWSGYPDKFNQWLPADSVHQSGTDIQNVD